MQCLAHRCGNLVHHEDLPEEENIGDKAAARLALRFFPDDVEVTSRMRVEKNLRAMPTSRPEAGVARRHLRQILELPDRPSSICLASGSSNKSAIAIDYR